MVRTSCSILLIFFVVLVVPITNGDGGGVSVWPIWNLKDPKVVSLAKFALEDYNTEVDKNLHLVDVLDGSYSVIKDGVERDYDVDLVFKAKDNSTVGPKKYGATIFYRPRRKDHPIKVKRVEIFKRYRPGGIWPIDNLKDPEVVSAAKFAVTQYNNKANTTLNFVTVIKGKRHAVGGSLYHLVISAKDNINANPKEYEVVVSARVWLKKDPLKLKSFKLLSKSIFN